MCEHTHTHTHAHINKHITIYSHTNTLAHYDPCKLIQAYKQTSRHSNTHVHVVNKDFINELKHKQITTNPKTFIRLTK